MEEGRIRLTTQEELCAKANSADSGFHEKQKARVGFYAYWIDKWDNLWAKIMLTIRW